MLIVGPEIFTEWINCITLESKGAPHPKKKKLKNYYRYNPRFIYMNLILVQKVDVED